MRFAAILVSLLALSIPLFAQSAAPFDPDAATRAYLDRLTPEQKAKSDGYFEGGYWLQFWNLLLGLAVAWALLQSGISRWMRDRASRVTRFATVHRLLYWIQYLILTSLVFLPWSIYTGFFREHQYDLSNQTFGGWMGDEVKGLIVGMILGGLLVAILYGVMRRYPSSWWIRGTGVMIAFLVIAIAIGPVFIAPLFNEYTRLDDPKVKDPILRMAHANGIPV
ncbi:MAG TPA: hypothetical protein VGF40_05730, partial [Thermoanaerobaculia bacterium]